MSLSFGGSCLTREQPQQALMDFEIAPVDPTIVGDDHSCLLDVLVHQRLERRSSCWITSSMPPMAWRSSSANSSCNGRRVCGTPPPVSNGRADPRALLARRPSATGAAIRRRVAGITRTERVCLDPGTVRSPTVQASLRVDRRRDPARSAIVRELASPARRAVVLRVRHGVQPFSLCCVRAGGRGREPHAVSRPGRVHQEGA